MRKRISVLSVLFFLLLGLWQVCLPVVSAETESNYRIEVDIVNQITTVFHNSDGSVARQMICSTGANNATPIGTFRMELTRPSTDRVEWYYIYEYGCYVRYATRIRGPILFHSLPYQEKDIDSIDADAESRMGTPASHGCIRLYWEDAKWIAMNCPPGTEVCIFNDAPSSPGLKRLLSIGGFNDEFGITYEQFLSDDFSAGNEGELGRGDSGPSISALQKRLGGLGFFDSSVSGIYDLPTIVAVMRYQASSGNEVTGIASADQISAIMTEDTIIGEYVALRIGMNGPLISCLQSNLRDIGLYYGVVNGIYSEELAVVIDNYCSIRHLEPVESVDYALLCDVNEFHRDLIEQFPEGNIEHAILSQTVISAVALNDAPLYQRPTSLSRKLTTVHKGSAVRLIERNVGWSRVDFGIRAGYMPNVTLRMESSDITDSFWGHRVDEVGVSELTQHCFGEAIPALQMRLRALGFYAGEYGFAYDTATANAIRFYQDAVGMEPTGIASAPLQAAIFESDVVTGTCVTLCEGDESPAVAAMQRALITLGYYDGASLGRFDEETAAALRLFLQDAGMSDTGDVGSTIQRTLLEKAEQKERK